MLHFSKMHGIGNDFVIVDAREQPLMLSVEQIRRLADRRCGVGFDQLLSVERSSDPTCAWAYGIWNTDGSKAGQCGNGVRCIAAWLAREGALGAGRVRLLSPSGPVQVELLVDGQIRVGIGVPQFDRAAIPLLLDRVGDLYKARAGDRNVTFDALSMGNPHAVIEVEDVDSAAVATLGPALENSDLFPQRCNIGFVQLLGRDQLRLRVWERGVGETRACGSGACAAVASLRRRDRVDDVVRVDLPGGTLQIEWPGPGMALSMTGPAVFAFDGDWHVD
ncbi:MAG: diaminopimelate epimerase [Dokdonella sp.]